MCLCTVVYVVLRCLAQLAAHEEGKRALLADSSACAALEALANTAGAAFSDEARDFASAALVALAEKELQLSTEGQQHIMLSCTSSTSSV